MKSIQKFEIIDTVFLLVLGHKDTIGARQVQFGNKTKYIRKIENVYNI